MFTYLIGLALVAWAVGAVLFFLYRFFTDGVSVLLGISLFSSVCWLTFWILVCVIFGTFSHIPFSTGAILGLSFALAFLLRHVPSFVVRLRIRRAA